MTDDPDRPEGNGEDLTADPWEGSSRVPPVPDLTGSSTTDPQDPAPGDDTTSPDGESIDSPSETTGSDTELVHAGPQASAEADSSVPDATEMLTVPEVEAIGRRDEPEDPQPDESPTDDGEGDPPEPEARSAKTNSLAERVLRWARNLPPALRDPSWRHSQQESFRFSLIVVTVLGLAYWFTNWPLPRLLSSHPDLNFYLIQPLIWLALAALALHGWFRLDERPPLSRMLVGVAFLVGLFHVAVLLIAGVVWTFGDSPLSGRFINYPKNLLYITTLLAGLEFARAFLFQAWRRYGEHLAFALVSAIFFVAVIPAAQWDVWDSFDHISTFVGGQWVPALALSILATFLVQYGGIGPSFGYRFALLAFTWFSPILPDLTWPILLILGVTVPLASASLIPSIYEDTTEGMERAESAKEAEPEPSYQYLPDRSAEAPKRRRRVGWAVTAGIALVIALFFGGALGFQMVAIEGISMEPSYERGDLAVVRESIDHELLEVGDVIVFHQGTRPVVHRITAIEETPGGLVFTTQGDNVSRADPPVSEDQIIGKVVFLIPEVGHINLWLRGG